ncbi:hypothetical protein PPYR_12579 [Photinus pyralis]|uniref:Pickpocket protein 28 n=1 Tax=Photinus pyralis TaxID=7054 RepID=A0A5N4A6R7_PHOPY|nr:pickpocket protein 28-like [Photinus pyralis]KAB0792959.1 hypothetical protein PPYR_12579 [Photinus pyralis]
MAVEQPKVNCQTNLSYYFTEYCDNSTIHGLKFIGERKRSFIEKVWWIVSVTFALYLCATMIKQTYKKWINSPVIVSFATSETPIWEIPFPAITICPLGKTDLTKFNFKEISPGNYTEEEAENLTSLALICPMVLELFPAINATRTIHDKAIDFLIDSVPDFDSSVRGCLWRNRFCDKESRKLFNPVLTSGAVCYSYNMLDWGDIYTDATDLDYYERLGIEHQSRSHWSPEDGYDENVKINIYPRRTSMTGTNGGMEVVLQTIVRDANYNCGDSLKGYKVMVHHPGEMPRFHQHYFWVPLDQLISVSIKPNMITTYGDLKSYKPWDRQCYFEEEKQLKYFKIYNQQNCLLECLTNITFEKCGCVNFHMPRTDDMPLCGPALLNCASSANDEFNRKRSSQRSHRYQDKSETFTDSTGCNCVPACYSLRYDAETSQLDWDWNNMLGVNKTFEENQTVHLSRLRVFFKDMQFMTSERNELYGQTEFWANCGGLVGLFTGFSLISFIEIVYFCSLRFICNLKRYGWRYWSGAEELLNVRE